MVKKSDNMIFFALVTVLVLVSLFSLGADYDTQYKKGEIYRIRNLNIGENIGNEARTVTGYEWGPLQRGVIYTNEGKTTYSQYLVFRETGADPVEAGAIVHEDNEEGIVGDYLKFEEGDDIFEYELIFDEGLESRISTNGELRSLYNERVNILGQEMVFMNSRANPMARSITLELFGGDVLDTLTEGQSEVYMIDGKRYEVRLLIVSDRGDRTVAKFVVNGQVTDALEEGEADILLDGNQIGIKTLLPNEAGEAAGGDIAEFYLGTHRIRLTDDDYTDDRFDSEVMIGTEEIRDGRVRIRAFGTTNFIVINSIEYRLSANSYRSGDVYIPPGQGLREYLYHPGGMLTSRWNMRYGGIISPVTESVIDFDSRGDEGYRLRFKNIAGRNYNFPLLDNSGAFKYGDDDNNFVFFEAVAQNAPNIMENDYFLLSDGSSHNSQSHIMQYKDFQSDQLIIEDLAGGTKKVTLKSSSIPGVTSEGRVNVGGNSYNIYVDAAGNLAVDQNNDGRVNGGKATITVLGGGIIDLGNTNNPAALSNFDMTVTTLRRNLDDAPGDEAIDVTFYNLANEVDLDVPDQTNIELESEKGNIDSGRARYSGSLYTMSDKRGANDLVINYPGGSGGGEVLLVVE